jgi:hypothetical protein
MGEEVEFSSNSLEELKFSSTERTGGSSGKRDLGNDLLWEASMYTFTVNEPNRLALQ